VNEKIPEPETKEAFLMSEGAWKPTKHTYVATRPVVLPGPDGEAYEHIFRCEATSVERRWGTVDPRSCR
jgi:hypothetical protein